MAITRTITPTKPKVPRTSPQTTISARQGVLCVAGIWLTVAALINLFGTFTPTAAKNEGMIRNVQVVASHLAPQTVSLNKKAEIDPALWNDLKRIQESALKRSPADPYAWSRLSWLRLKAGDGDQAAFAALRMSDLVSPNEAPQLAERALNWRRFHDVQTPEQQRYQTTLWHKAFLLDDQETLRVAVVNALTDEVGKAIAELNPVAYQDWAWRLEQIGKTQ